MLDDEPYLVTSADFMRKQKTRPVMRTQLKNLRTGNTKDHSFQQSDKVAEADIERTPMQFLFSTADTFTFMDQTSYEQVEISRNIVGDAEPWLIEGQTADILLFAGDPVSLELPIKIDRTVTEAPPGVRGDTSTNVMKEVEVEGNAKVKAPLFVNEGDVIRIDTRTGTYVERVS